MRAAGTPPPDPTTVRTLKKGINEGGEDMNSLVRAALQHGFDFDLFDAEGGRAGRTYTAYFGQTPGATPLDGANTIRNLFLQLGDKMPHNKYGLYCDGSAFEWLLSWPVEGRVLRDDQQGDGPVVRQTKPTRARQFQHLYQRLVQQKRAHRRGFLHHEGPRDRRRKGGHRRGGRGVAVRGRRGHEEAVRRPEVQGGTGGTASVEFFSCERERLGNKSTLE
ncbi:hypothetical protein G7Y89_g4801 [Cudoniella acicularis]|uniref:Uncharacterized protein n=1 Tax=Cudoniella acicularis TaxID=354080 RepID=A0A8H4RQ64_9HELO|nr:hypothetical protein G7Y89_g4801 [Cudoniella acicularis]